SPSSGITSAVSRGRRNPSPSNSESKISAASSISHACQLSVDFLPSNNSSVRCAPRLSHQPSPFTFMGAAASGIHRAAPNDTAKPSRRMRLTHVMRASIRVNTPLYARVVVVELVVFAQQRPAINGAVFDAISLTPLQRDLFTGLDLEPIFVTTDAKSLDQ